MNNGRHRTGRKRLPLLGIGGAAIAAAVVAVAIGLTQVAGGQACASAASAAGTVSGIATHYVLQPGQGNCSFPVPPGGGLYVALSPTEYDNAAPCGSYLQVTGPDGSVRVEVADQCPPCAAGHIDLSATAFADIAPLSAGLVPVSYGVITDPPLPGPLEVRVKEGSSRYWLALLILNTGNPLTSVQVRTASGGWTSLARASFNYWIAQSGAGPGPFTVRLTDTLGHQVTVSDVQLEPGVVEDTGAWMYGAGAVPSASATPSPSATRRRPVPAHPAASAAASAAARQPTTPIPQVGVLPEPAARGPSAGPTC
jgi:expansin (peptidoglycan-binding protein)